jgi:LysM repeat protein
VKKTVAATPPPRPNGKTHTVQAGETFYSISKKYRIDTALLIAANPSVSPSALRPGQVLSLISKEAPTAAPLPEPTPVETPVVENEAIDPPPVSQPSPPSEAVEPGNTVTIDDEMTYAEFAAKHGTTVEKLNANNGFDLVGSTILAKGSQIYVTEKN